jgi:hypothetical protein
MVYYIAQAMKERDHLEDMGVDGNKIFEWILGKQSRFIWLRIGTRGGSL